MNIEEIMRQAQRAQNTLRKRLAEFSATEFEYNYKELILIKIMGSLEIKKIDFLDADIIDPEDTEMLSDTIMMAINEAVKKVNADRQAIKDSIAPGLGDI